MMSGFKGIINVLEDLLKEWDNARGDFKEVLKLLEKPSFEVILTKMNDILQTIFYWNAFDTSNMLISELKRSTQHISLSHYITYPVMMAIAVLFYVTFVQEIRRIMVSFYAILLIFPFRLIESNAVMVHHLQRVRKGDIPLY